MSSAELMLSEGSQRFAFDADRWSAAIKYDDSSTHRLILRSVEGTKAVDFVVLGHASPALALIEVKDFRGHGAENRPRLRGPLANEVAAKIAGTLAGLIGAARGNRVDFDWRAATQKLINPELRLLVVLHVESDDWYSVEDAKSAMSVLALQLERALSWLSDCKVLVCNQAVPGIPDCVVTTAPNRDGPSR
jgi:hypothetical protein